MACRHKLHRAVRIVKTTNVALRLVPWNHMRATRAQPGTSLVILPWALVTEGSSNMKGAGANYCWHDSTCSR